MLPTVPDPMPYPLFKIEPLIDFGPRYIISGRGKWLLDVDKPASSR